ncbi:MAG: LamG-like jellyroll fold domain-containing protein [FCB group bacterium]|jgi:hypothetical protein
MRYLIHGIFCLILILNISFSQGGEVQHYSYCASQFFQIQREASQNTTNVRQSLDLKHGNSQYLSGKYLYKQTLNYVSKAKELTMTDFALSANENVTFELERTRSVVDANTIFQIGGKEDTHFVETQHSTFPEVYCFSGKIMGENNSKVFFCFVGNYCFASIQRQDGSKYVLGPSPESKDDFDRLNLQTDYIIINEKDIYSQKNINESFKPFYCLTDQIPQPNELNSFSGNNHKGTDKPLTDSLIETEIAIETDTEFFKATGSDTAKAQAYAIALLSLVSRVYEEEVNVCFYLTWLKTWTDNPSDPYNLKGNGQSIPDVVINYWKNNYKDVKRDLAHVMTSIGYGGGGYGYYDALCGVAGDYSLSLSSPQCGYKLPTFAFTYDVYIVAHEIGHNFNARHTHSCYYGYPLDTCVTDEGIAGKCLDSSQKPKPNPGSIMSYCGGINNNNGLGWQVRMTFLPPVQNVIRQTAEKAACLSEPVQPQVRLLTPKGNESLNAGDSLLIKWTSARVSNVSLEYSVDNGHDWITIISDITASNMKYNWKTPEICSNKIKVRLFDALNKLTADTCIFPFTINKDDTTGLYAYYPFNGNSNDEQFCHYFNATENVNAILTKDRYDSLNSAYLFKGNSYLKVPNFNTDFDQFTVSFWFKADSANGKQNFIGTNYSEGAVFEIYFWNLLGVSYYVDGNGTPKQIWGPSVSLNKWTHFAFTYNGKEAIVYRDGQETNRITDSITHKLNKAQTPLYIGSRGVNDYFNGAIDDIKIYRKALTDEQILSLYNEKTSSYVPDSYSTDNYVSDILELQQIIYDQSKPYITLNIKTPSFVVLSLYEYTGQKIAVLNNSNLEPGYYSLNTSSLNLPAGIYFCLAQINETSSNNIIVYKKFAILR